MKNVAILVVDEQIDFTRDFGSLYVPGGEKAARLTGRWIRDNKPDAVFCTLDWHNASHVSMKRGWIGSFPKKIDYPFEITPEQVKNGDFKPNGYMLLDLNTRTEPYIVWPDHCLAFTGGASLDINLKNRIDEWEIETGKRAEYILKGQDRGQEEFSAFGYKTKELKDDPWLIRLSGYNKVYVAGVAKEYCVAACLKSMRDSRLFKENQIIELPECIAGFDD